MNVTAPAHPPGRPMGEAALDLLDTLTRGECTTLGLIADTGRDRREVVVTLANLRKRGKVERVGHVWRLTPDGRAITESTRTRRAS